jgi:hypothetical protein
MNVNNVELKWFIGNTLPVPDKLNIEWEDDLEIECEINHSEWDENKPTYSFICDYMNGNREVVEIPLEDIIEKYVQWKKWNKGYHLDHVTECCILERLRLL